MNTSSIIIGAVLLIGPIFLISCMAIGVFGFSPDRAAAIRSAESETPVIMEEIRRIHIRQPENFRHDRLDRHPVYLAVHVAVWGYAWCIFAGAPVTSNLAILSPQVKLTMAIGFIVGSTLVLAGSAMGGRIGRWTLLKGIRDNLTSSMLADDIRLPYTFGASGQLAVGVSMCIYATTSFQSTLGSLGGWLTGALTVSCGTMIALLYLRIRRYERARTTLIDEAVAQIHDERDHVAD